MNLVVDRRLVRQYAVGVYGKRTFRDNDAVVSSGSRLFFITPWRHLSLIGTAHLPYHGDPDALAVTEEDVQNFINEVNEAYPAVALKREEVRAVHRGLLPMDETNSAAGDVKLVKKYIILDHQQSEGIEGLISVIGVKYTTARHVAQYAADLIFRKLGKVPPPSRTATTPVYGGNIGSLSELLAKGTAKHARTLGPETVWHLVHNYGTAYPEVLQHVEKNPSLGQPLTPTSPVIKAEVVHAVREEMALKLVDVVLRRTELGSAGSPGESCLWACAEVMAAELGWGGMKELREIAEANRVFSSLSGGESRRSASEEGQRAIL
jgi:glycerol-3-phosphate dehydrogenase